MILSCKQFPPLSETVEVEVPASKSILTRALALAALSDGNVFLACGALCEDTRAFVGCLRALGIEAERSADGITVHGCGGRIPNAQAEIDVKSAGTAARFLPSLLALCGGDYLFTSSEQMQKRPMEFLQTLERLGAEITYSGERGKFPFRLRSKGIAVDGAEIDTDMSTQYASGLLLALYGAKQPSRILLKGTRTHGSYIEMTLGLLRAFGAETLRTGDEITVLPARTFPARFAVEGDVSGACYFAALALLKQCKVLLKGIAPDSLQGDIKFLKLLEEKGLRLKKQDDGLLADGSGVPSFTGFDCDFSDFSDQTATAAALAPFAASPTRLKNVGHIRFQECDRVSAIVNNLNALGGTALVEGEDIVILPAPLTGGRVTTYGDHRIAMAFALAGTRAERVELDDPACVKKTFEDFFGQLKKFMR